MDELTRPLKNIHEVLKDSSFATDAASAEIDESLKAMGTKVPPRLKEITEHILRSNGSNAYRFFRQCAEQLAEDYLGRPWDKA